MYSRCQHSSCFTGNYARFLNGAGSVLVTDSLFQPLDAETKKPVDLENSTDMLLWTGKLRWFTPAEAFALMGFRPEDFQVPGGPRGGATGASSNPVISDTALWKCAGNSLNPQVVGRLLEAHLAGFVPQVWRCPASGQLWTDGRLPS